MWYWVGDSVLFGILLPRVVADRPAPIVSFCRCRNGLCPRYVSCNEHISHILAVLCVLTLFWVSTWLLMLEYSYSWAILLSSHSHCVQNPTFADCNVYTITAGRQKAGNIHVSFGLLFIFSSWAFGMYKRFLNVVVVVVVWPLDSNWPFACALQRYALLHWYAPKRPHYHKKVTIGFDSIWKTWYC